VSSITKFLIGIVYVLAFVGSFSVAEAVLDRDAPITFESAKVLTPTVPQGGVLDIQYTTILRRTCASTADRFVTDADGNVHVPSTYTVGQNALIDSFPPEGRQTYHRSITIPLAASLGPAKYDARFSYICNILQKLSFPIVVNSPTVEFEIVPAPAPLEPLTPE
jgi:hypothetical protein